MGCTLSRRKLGDQRPQVDSWLNGEMPVVPAVSATENPPEQAETVKLAAIKGLEPGGSLWQDLFRKPITIERNGNKPYKMNGGVLAWKMKHNWDEIQPSLNGDLEGVETLDTTLKKLIGAWKDAAQQIVPPVLHETKKLLENKINKIGLEKSIFEEYWEEVPLMEKPDWYEKIKEIEEVAMGNAMENEYEAIGNAEVSFEQLKEFDTWMAEAAESTKALGSTEPDAEAQIVANVVYGGLAIAGVSIGGLIVWATVRMQRIRRTQANTEESDELLEYGYDLIYTPLPRTPIELVPSNTNDDTDDEKQQSVSTNDDTDDEKQQGVSTKDDTDDEKERNDSYTEMVRTCEDNKYDYGIRLILNEEREEREHNKLLKLKSERDEILNKLQSDNQAGQKQRSKYIKKCEKLEKKIRELEKHSYDDQAMPDDRRRLSTHPAGNPLARMLMEIQSESPNTPELEAIPGNEIVVEQKTELAVLVPIAISVAVLVCLYRKLSLRNTK